MSRTRSTSAAAVMPRLDKRGGVLSAAEQSFAQDGARAASAKASAIPMILLLVRRLGVVLRSRFGGSDSLLRFGVAPDFPQRELRL